MMPTSYEISVAIVAACKETGAHPLDVANGAEREHGYPVSDSVKISRARAYAGRAIDRVFNRPEIAIARPDIARFIGVNRPSWAAYFSGLDGRPLSWWNEDTFKRVVDAVMDCEPPEDQIKAASDPVQSSPQTVQSPPQTVQKPAPPPVKPPVQQRVPDPVRPPARTTTPIGTLEPGGYRPAPGTYEKVLQSDKAEKQFSGAYVPVGRPAAKKNDDFLRRAVENTARMTPPPEKD